MKNIIIIVTAVFAICFLASSCSKDYTCVCTVITEFDEEDPDTSVSTVDFTAISTRKAKKDCEVNVTQTMMGMKQSTVCVVK